MGIVRRITVSILLCSVLACPLSAQAVDVQDDREHIPKRSFKQKIGRVFKGMASWYGGKFHGRRTASGQIYDKNKLTCAHRSLPFGTDVQVTNPENGSKVDVIVTDRGPFHGNRIIDLSKAAARKLGITGVAKVVCRAVSRRNVASKPTSEQQ